MREFVEKLKKHLADNEDSFRSVEYVKEGYCTTCYYEDEVVYIDGDALWNEIDVFCATFENK